MSRRPWSLCLVLLAAAAPTDPVVVAVGDRVVTRTELEERVAALPEARFHDLPRGAAGIRAFVDEVLVPELLLSEHARTITLPTHQRDRALAFALEAELARRVTVDAESLARFYADHRDRFDTPEAVAVWRIVTDSEAEARDILTEVRGKATGAAIWSTLARERSLDAATKMRRGDLGFVHADGKTDVPEVRVNPDVFKAASALADGELAAEPIADGEHFSALWRRGSRPARAVPLERAEAEIRRILLRERAAQALAELLGRLRRERVSSYAPEQIESVSYALPETTRHRRPLVQRAAQASPAPTQTPSGER